ncbi:hypothetical protein [Psychroserpens ponticola]|uniref:SH3 domain-containing protein n=1 Tax=Psychroserpens ponticola TaxID=2932268 RepID=A0ABY7S221_9FLAO|nr:hypothetical protein [Psychroserpens ponticola]WCO03229.1 hypothetical protein MUN68_006950 [Psychroserpens ponticola]
MKCFRLLLLLLFSINLFAQESDTIHYKNLVEAYYDKETKKPLYIYDNIKGIIVDTLKNIDTKNSWYKIAILDSEYGWFKIKNIQRLPNAYKNYGYENYWVKTSDFLISVDHIDKKHRAYLYDEPTNESNKIHKIDSFKTVHVTETIDLWAMVSFKVGKKTIRGWLSFKDQCAYPWTSCTKY